MIVNVRMNVNRQDKGYYVWCVRMNQDEYSPIVVPKEMLDMNAYAFAPQSPMDMIDNMSLLAYRNQFDALDWKDRIDTMYSQYDCVVLHIPEETFSQLNVALEDFANTLKKQVSKISNAYEALRMLGSISVPSESEIVLKMIDAANGAGSYVDRNMNVRTATCRPEKITPDFEDERDYDEDNCDYDEEDNDDDDWDDDNENYFATHSFF